LTITFSSDGQVPLEQFIMENLFHSPPDAKHGRPDRGVPLMSKLPCLKRANHFLGCSFSSRVFSVFFFLYDAAAHIGPWPPLCEVP
jgi:hypothetical protein